MSAVFHVILLPIFVYIFFSRVYSFWDGLSLWSVRSDSQGLPDFCEVLECAWTITGDTQKRRLIFQHKTFIRLNSSDKEKEIYVNEDLFVNSLIKEAPIESK